MRRSRKTPKKSRKSWRFSSELDEEGLHPEAEHIPVLRNEVTAGLSPRPAGRYIDATTGLGGHSRAILEASSPGGRLLCLDADASALQVAQQNLSEFASRVSFVNSNFSTIETAATANGFGEVDGIVFDLGVSSLQLGAPERGFSFQQDGPLDMRMSGDGPTAADLVNRLPEPELADIIWRYGEEKFSRRIAREIASNRPIHTTGELSRLVAATKPRTEKIHPATRTFQALRIAVNGELEALEAALPQAIRLLVPGGRLAVISFHSLEDRIVKQFFRTESQDCICPPQAPVCTCTHRASLRVLNRRPIVPSAEELEHNRRSRSAKLRLVERL